MLPMKQGYKSFDRELNSSGVEWYLFPRMPEDDARAQAKLLESYEGGSGLPYARPAGVRHSKSRTLIKQAVGHNI